MAKEQMELHADAKGAKFDWKFLEIFGCGPSTFYLSSITDGYTCTPNFEVRMCSSDS